MFLPDQLRALDMSTVPLEQVPAVLAQLAALQAQLCARLLLPSLPARDEADDDEMLSPDEAAVALKQSRRWLRGNVHRLPFVKRISPRRFVCSRRGIERWLARR